MDKLDFPVPNIFTRIQYQDGWLRVLGREKLTDDALGGSLASLCSLTPTRMTGTLWSYTGYGSHFTRLQRYGYSGRIMDTVRTVDGQPYPDLRFSTPLGSISYTSQIAVNSSCVLLLPTCLAFSGRFKAAYVITMWRRGKHIIKWNLKREQKKQLWQLCWTFSPLNIPS